MKGKADLKLSSITLADNKEFQCSVLIPGDDEGKLSDKAQLVVLGSISFTFSEIFCFFKVLTTCLKMLHDLILSPYFLCFV